MKLRLDTDSHMKVVITVVLQLKVAKLQFFSASSSASFADAASPLLLNQVHATFAPAAAQSRTICAPMPRAPPTIRIFFPARSRLIRTPP